MMWLVLSSFNSRGAGLRDFKSSMLPSANVIKVITSTSDRASLKALQYSNNQGVETKLPPINNSVKVSNGERCSLEFKL